MDSQQLTTGRKAGRPVSPETEPKQDIHLWLKQSFLKQIDDNRGEEGRTAYIIRVLTEYLEGREISPPV